MKFTFQTPDGKRVVCDSDDDVLVYDAPNNPPNTGTRYTRGTDIYAHTAKSGNHYFYAYSWSMWQGEESTADLWTKEQVEEFIIDRMSGPSESRPTAFELEQLAEYGVNVLDETA